MVVSNSLLSETESSRVNFILNRFYQRACAGLGNFITILIVYRPLTAHNH